MRDFRAALTSDSSSQSPTIGGDAFHLPSIFPLTAITTGIGSLLGISSLAMLLRPWRILSAIPFRRGGGISALFAWGRLAALLLAATLFLAPDMVQSAFPEWRQVAIFCMFASGLSVLAAISRCCGSALSCAFWVALTLFLGQKAAIGGSDLAGTGIALNSVTEVFSSAEKNSSEWEDMVTGQPVSNTQLSQFRRAPVQRRAAPVQLAAQLGVANNSQGLFDGISASLVNQLGSSISGPAEALGFTVQNGGRDWRDGAALPESAYFGSPAVINSGTSSGGSAGPIDQIVAKVSSFIK
jgi:hypothetical protein